MLQKRISDVQWDHYPTNRMLPQETVFNIFFKNYKDQDSKADFLNNHKYLKLREGYFSLFAVKAFDEIEGRLHYMIFTNEDDGDVAFLAETKPGNRQIEKIQFDIKEYHKSDPQTFSAFLDSISGKRKVLNNHYGLILCLNRDTLVDENILNKLKTLSTTLSRGVFICSADRDFDLDPKRGLVSYFAHGKLVYQNKITITNNDIEVNIIYHDEI